jgi:Protein of unknown function (DUF429)
MRGFGIDLAGYMTGKTSLAFAETAGRAAHVTILKNSCLSIKHKSNANFDAVIANDVAALRQCFEIAPIAVDVPVDLQGLPNVKRPKELWELTRRPIDMALNGLPPFAAFIGAPVARFAAIISAGKFEKLVGESLFEAYPSQTWKKAGIEAGKYKGNAGTDARILLCKGLNIEPCVDNDDDIDAIICALTAAATDEKLCGAAEFKTLKGPLPKGFRILKTFGFDAITVTAEEFEPWMKVRKS